ncbi:dimethylaniline monooxygenase [Basidiobolus ranarum]|uniref:Dimethylaniline monooxygenase n=1 Tax=Basidiobolus ranarum TaxID=34480 RepID=A0ABR2WFJ0_9FUNG
MYKNIVFIMSRDMSPFPDFPIPSSWPTFLPQPKVREYLNNYSKEFHLENHIKFNHKVTQLKPFKEGWEVSYEKEGLLDKLYVDHVIVANGHNSCPIMPKFKGMDRFKGSIIHSTMYHDPSEFVGKRVVVVGSGTTSCDIASEMSYVAKEVIISSRSGAYIFPRLTGAGKPVDLSLNRFLTWLIPSWLSNYLASNFILIPGTGWLKPKKLSLFEKSPAASAMMLERLASGSVLTEPGIDCFLEDAKSIRFTNGDIISDIDTVILATGYQLHFPFFTEKEVHKYVLGEQPSEKSSLENGPLWLHEGIFPPHYPSIAFLGLVFTLDSAMILSDVQIRYITSVWTDRVKLPKKAAMDSLLVKKKEHLPATQRSIWEPNQNYLNDLAKICGFFPSFWSIVREHHSLSLAWKSWFSPRWPANFRLVGFGKWTGASNVIEQQYNDSSKSK